MKGQMTIPVFLLLSLITCSVNLYADNAVWKRKIYRKEKKADQLFIRGDYTKSIDLYESLLNSSKLKNKQDLELLHLKIARLSTALMLHNNAVNHYSYVFESNQERLTIEDVCNYMDALRQCGLHSRAELVCRSFAFDDSFFQNQRFNNMLNSLTYHRHYSLFPDDGVYLAKLPLSSSASEDWIGEYKGEKIYARSRSHVHDPSKIFFHQNHYMLLNDSIETPVVFPNLPVAMQNGPVVFSSDGSLMIATLNEYNGVDYIDNPNSENPIYRTNLCFSVYDKKKKRWSQYEPIFNNEGVYNYAHPFLSDNDSVLFFSSNRPGGYGGMDLYKSKRINEREWGTPINLGPIVNTEGNEIFPYVYNHKLCFSSNGLPGNGGYDLFRVTLEKTQPLKGTLYHFSNPVNSAFNDFGYKIVDDSEYFVSDRDSARDDIFVIKRLDAGLGLNQDIHKLNVENAISGVSNIVHGFNNSITEGMEELKGNSSLYKLYKEKDVLLSVYFDFDSDQITPESKEKIREMMSLDGLENIESLMVIGYADEFGSVQYNQNLSESRAIKVANEIARFNIVPTIYFEGRGKLHLNLDFINKDKIRVNLDSELSAINNKYSDEEKKRLLKPARKVDIIVDRVKRTNTTLNK